MPKGYQLPPQHPFCASYPHRCGSRKSGREVGEGRRNRIESTLPCWSPGDQHPEPVTPQLRPVSQMRFNCCCTVRRWRLLCLLTSLTVCTGKPAPAFPCAPGSQLPRLYLQSPSGQREHGLRHTPPPAQCLLSAMLPVTTDRQGPQILTNLGPALYAPPPADLTWPLDPSLAMPARAQLCPLQDYDVWACVSRPGGCYDAVP